jgi:hypothetical protein
MNQILQNWSKKETKKIELRQNAILLVIKDL